MVSLAESTYWPSWYCFTADAVVRAAVSLVSRQKAVSQKRASEPVVRVQSDPETQEYSPGPVRVPAAEAVVRVRRVRPGNRPGRRLRPP